MLARSFCSTFSLLLLLTNHVCGLAGHRQRKQADDTPASDLSRLAKLFPSSSLPPPTGLTLKYVALGVGTQNYTCTTGDPTAVPGTTGARATLYDIGSKLNNDAWAQYKIDSISGIALAASFDTQVLTYALQAQGYDDILGHHFFSTVAGVNTPHFTLDQLHPPCPQAIVSKSGEVAAPSNAYPGENSLPAISWLYLKDTTGLSSGGINTVYRVETAGGNKPATCQGQPDHFEVKYAAQYWIFGPAL